ncbi:hypoxanthine phosphoribosyltransferase, partial [candidate division KSB3 bacterium]|nr:hypoxanthine phosphoribosyltransferase [candidate division KSB3 bacterium]MBD3323476.1 hypoxanthine phosphoribosyltransferase [candidate division KSB3 bacterium]
MLDDKIQEILVTEEMIRQRVQDMAQQISQEYAGKEPIIISILKGGVYFLTDLTHAMTIPH